jgi:glycosyltransferase involved in cell wall biosynthesis
MQPSDAQALLESMDRAHVPDDVAEIRLFSKCRNERLRLPAFLRHYRNLGVHRFFVVDNASSDGSAEYLEQQPDVHVFGVEGSFRAARGGTDWLNALLARFGVGKWCVTVDIDELLYYPGLEKAGLMHLTRYFDEHQYQAMCCQLLDMYPDGPIRYCDYAPGDELVTIAPFFDAGPYRRLPYGECPGVLIYGGVRERAFFPESWAHDWRRHLHVTLYHRVLLSLPLLRDSPWILARRPLFPPCLTKVPLVRWDAASSYLNVNHFVTPKKLAQESGVLLHFKLLQDFHARAAQEVARGEYYDGAVEFRRYATKLRDEPELTFRYEGSIRFEAGTQLVRLGLMQDTVAWLQARQSAADPDVRQ